MLPQDDGPKYKTKKRDKDVGQFFHVNYGNDTCVIVEDFISAVKCSRHADAMCLMTVHLGDEELDRLLRYKKVVIFLDDDNKEVRDAQKRIKQRLSLVVPEVKLVRHVGKDPKELSDEKLKEVIENHDVHHY